jgi:hypothetical protein
MANKKLIFFATCSMVVSGLTLASNVTLADKLGRFIADAFQFEGPISGLVQALVRSQDQNGDKPVISFQVQGVREVAVDGSAAAAVVIPMTGPNAAPSSVAAAGGAGDMVQRREVPKTGGPTGQPLIAVGPGNNSEVFIPKQRVLKGMGNGDVTATLVGDRPDGPTGNLKFNAVGNPLGGAGAVEIPAFGVSAQAEVQMVLAAVTNGDVIGGVAVAEATDDPGATAQAITEQAVQPSVRTTNAVAGVPVPASALLIALGFGVFVARRSLKSRA